MRGAERPVRDGRGHGAGRGTASGVWRWRGSPLCRPTDRAEAWVALVAVLVIVLVAPLAGLFVGLRADARLQHEVRVQHRERHATTGVVLRAVRERTADGGVAVSTGYPGPVSVLARWTGHDGREHTGRATTLRRAAEAGDTVPLWTDDRGRLVNRPVDSGTAAAQAALIGLGAAVVPAALAHGARRLVVRRLARRRYARLDREWAEVGPEWGRTGTGG
ncbi:hypothetical protein ACFYVL_30220 [Streptomyces sp. NPDC004111]|uniref:Rv1733c family protein n=1 Tax=Streptomyces sp. NPDC004111 TaxID=3364690 RepID=UPI0036B5B605